MSDRIRNVKEKYNIGDDAFSKAVAAIKKAPAIKK